MAVAAVCVLSACAGDDITDSDADDPEFTLVEEGVSLNPAVGRAMGERDGAAEEQLSTLDDGLLTFAEYEQGMLAAVDCARESGSEVINRGVDHTQGYPRIELAIPEDGLDAFDDCNARHAKSVARIWDLGHSSVETDDDAEERAEVRRRFLECVHRAGDLAFDVDAVASGDVSIQVVVDEANRIVDDGGTNCFDETGFGDTG